MDFLKDVRQRAGEGGGALWRENYLHLECVSSELLRAKRAELPDRVKILRGS